MGKVIVFDDGSIQSQVLKKECENNQSIEVETQTIKANPKSIEKYIEKVKDKTSSVYLPFTLEDFNKYDIDTQRKNIATKYPEISIFYAYEFMTNDAVLERAKGYGLDKKEEPKSEEGTK
jgi:hypothetical protein